MPTTYDSVTGMPRYRAPEDVEEENMAEEEPQEAVGWRTSQRRELALQAAISADPAADPADIIKRAEAYLTFLEGE